MVGDMVPDVCPAVLEEALGRLPGVYSLGLRLRGAGLPDELIAECLAVEPEAIGPLLEVAEAKLAALLDGGCH